MSKYRKVPVADLIVDERYQRPLDQTRVQRMADDFNDRLFGVLEVAQRNGKSAVFDGQHRLAAAKVIGRESVPCLVHTDLDPENEADLFVELQRKRKSVQPVDAFKARVFAGEESAYVINAVVEACGFSVTQGSGEQNGHRRQIAAIGALERVYKLGVLAEALTLLSDVWDGDKKSTDGWIVEGLGILVAGYGHRLTDTHIDKLAEIPPSTFIRRAKARADMTTNSISRGKAVAVELRKALGLRGMAMGQKKKAKGKKKVAVAA